PPFLQRATPLSASEIDPRTVVLQLREQGGRFSLTKCLNRVTDQAHVRTIDTGGALGGSLGFFQGGQATFEGPRGDRDALIHFLDSHCSEGARKGRVLEQGEFKQRSTGGARDSFL